MPDDVPLTKGETAAATFTSISTVDRARASGALEWVAWNNGRVRIWSQEARRWFLLGCPTTLLILFLVFALVTFAYGCSPAGRSAQKKHHHHQTTYGALSQKPARTAGYRRKRRR